VKLLVFDDGGDPARHRAQVQEAIEQRRALAFLMNAEPFTGAGSVDYITKKRVPVIGGSTGEPWAFTSPMYFPQQANGDAAFYAHLASAAQQLVPSGKTKLGSLVCIEAASCSATADLYAKHAAEFGFDLVYKGKASLGQPDFTAECISARNAGVQVLIPLFDSSTVARLAASCARQGYKPAFAIFTGIVVAAQAKDPNFADPVGSTDTFPWFQTGTPATDEYQDTLRRYGAGIPPGAATPMGWTAGKLLQRAASNLPEPPTTEAILQGLWALKGDTLDGLTAPLAFVENQPPSPLACWFNIAAKNGAWVSPDQFKLHCHPFRG
jgi:branched-chain amino acid transport system substrate-binding protein